MSGRRSIWSVLPINGAAVLVASALAGVCTPGCNSKPAPSPPAAAPQPDPQGQLDEIIGRLEYALNNAKNVAGAGVVSSRECKYELLEPTDEAPYRRAEVSIITRVSVTGKREPPKSTDPVAGAEATIKSLENQVERLKPTVETDKYLLQYENGRWRLQTDVASEMHKICWDYALSD